MSPGTIGELIATYVRPAVDILLLAFLIYKTYQILVRTQAMQLVRGIILLMGIYGAAFFLKLPTVTWILSIIAPGLVIGLAIIFQPELRKIFLKLGQGGLFRPGVRPKAGMIEGVVTAAEILSEKKRGALVVFARTVGLKSFIEKGVRLDAVPSGSLIISIFGHDTPLHDGAAIIQSGRVAAAGCFLPLSEQQDIRKSFGTRHRAALGITEEADAVVLVVSEETGALSLAYDSKLYYGLSGAQVRERLAELLGGTPHHASGDEEPVPETEELS
jgi:diadenylate cyclase